HGDGDDPLAPDDISDDADEGRAQGDSQGRGADREADLRGTGIEVAREERKQRLRRIEIDEGAEARNSDREPAGIGEHRALQSLFVIVRPRRRGHPTVGMARPCRYGTLAW